MNHSVRIEFTKHAKERMSRYGISESEVIETLIYLFQNVSYMVTFGVVLTLMFQGPDCVV